MRNDLFRAPSFLAVALLAAAPLTGCGGPSTTGEALTQDSQVSASGPLAVSASGIFFFNEAAATDFALSRVPLAGGAPVTLDPNPPASDWLVVDEDSVFYGGAVATTNDTGPATFTISRVLQQGGSPEELVTGTGTMAGMAEGGGRLAYVAQAPNKVSSSGDVTKGTGTIFVVPSAEAAPKPAAPTPLAKGLPQPCALAADDAKVYWLDCTRMELLSLPFSPATGEKPAVLASALSLDVEVAGAGGSLPLTVAGGQLYWFEGAEVRTMPAAGGAPSTIASEDDWAPSQVMADATAVYWTTAWDYSGASGDGPDVNDRDPGMWTADAGGGLVSQVLGLDASLDGGAAMDAEFVYWIGQNGSVRRLHR